ncbi:glutamate receptor ionotropic, delta-2-like [Myzus persicae]|uniref:glutamate receptor ionotropic, delta-2-like n=1 Tax=Myzus persicae TaxID=13164 RepID=UPI000B932BE8|nr:glutamate receptor ionotropic, delta-2-like [Myzus persicae]
MEYINIVLPFLSTYIVSVSLSVNNFDAQHELMEQFLTVRNLDTAIFYTCWSLSDRVRYMKKLNEKKIAVTHRSKEDFFRDFNLDDLFTITVYSPLLGIIIDWSCNDDSLFKFSESWLWNSSYHWLMIMSKKSNNNIQSFVSSKKINLTIDSEILLAYPNEMDGIITNWHIFDIYRTAFEPRGKLMIDVVNTTFGKWGNRLWKFDKRSNLGNLTLNVVTIGNPYGALAKKNGTDIKPSSEDLVTYLKTFNLDRLNSVQKFSFAIMYPLTRILLNITLHIETTNSWGYKMNNKWDGIVGMLISGEADFSISLNALRSERYDVVDYSAISTWKHLPCFIFRHPRSSTASTNIFLRPFETAVWFSIICVVILSGFVYCTIMHYESNQIFSLRVLSDIVLLKIGTLCQQGTAMEPTKLSNRLIVILMFAFSLIMYQFYSSSIVSGLLRPTIMNIDSVQKLEESGLDVGIEDFNVVTKVIEVYGEINPYLKKIIDNKIKPKSEYLLAKDGVRKIKKGHYAFFTDPATSYWLINDIFTEKEKCDLTELPLHRPETTGYLVRKKSPYRKLINYANCILRETGLMDRELRIWHAEKPKCSAGKTTTEESLVSVKINDIVSLFAFLIIGFISSFTILILEIIVHRHNTNTPIIVNK